MAADGAEVRVRLEELDDVARADHEHHHRDHGLEGPEPEALQSENGECAHSRDSRGRQQRDSEQQVQPQRCAEELREVRCNRDRLRLDPEADDDASWKAVAADFGEISSRCDAELGRQRLDQHRHQVRGDDHPDERVAVARATGDVRREVPRVDVGDRCDEGGADEGEEPEPRGALEHALAVVD
jgi:hypothetical protein